MLDRTVAPPFVKSSSFHLITPREKKLSNGIDVFFIPGGSQDVLKIELIFDAGRWREKHTLAGYFTANMLSKGTKGKNSYEIAQIFDQYGAHLEVMPGLDFVHVSVYALTKNLAPALSLLTEIVTAPTFPDHELRQTQAVFIQSLNINNEKTSYVASQRFRKNIYGDNHPYGIEISETHVRDLEREHLKAHFEEFFHSPLVFVSGKITAESEGLIKEQLEKISAAGAVTAMPYPIGPAKMMEHVKKEDSVQASVRIGTRSVMRHDPHYVDVLFVSHILGGYFGSRLMKNIREEKGLTYGISASVHGLKHDSYLVIGADVNKENVDLTFAEISKELKKLRTTKISSDELETTRNHFIGSLQAEITTPFAHAEKIKTIKLFNLQTDHYQKMITRIEKMTASDIAAISEQYYHEDSFLRVAVG